MNRSRAIRLVMLLLLVFQVGRLQCQTESGTLRVLVTDRSSAIVRNASVHLTNIEKGTEEEKITDSEGYATFAPVTPGRYSVDVKGNGFQDLEIQNIVQDVNARRLVRAVLVPASVSASVVVSEEGNTLQTEEGSLGQVVSGTVARELPLPQRRYTELPLLAPGIARSTISTASAGSGWFVANGNYHTQNSYTLDGIDNNQGSTNAQSLSAQVIQPSPDAIAEFKVQSSAYSADIGRGAGAVVNVVLRSGTNKMHGSAWYYNRDSSLAAQSWTSKLSNTPKSDLSWHQFGGTLGGPILKDKLFYFMDYEGFLNSSSSPSLVTVPTLEQRAGVFYRTITNPATRTPYANNTIPVSDRDALGQRLINLYPTPNRAGNRASSGQITSNYAANLAAQENTQKGDVKVDQTITSKDSVSYRWGYLRQNITRDGILPGAADGGSTGGQFNTNQSAGLTYTRIITPRFANVFRVGYTRTYAEFTPSSQNTQDPEAFGFRNLPNPFGLRSLPTISTSNYQQLGIGSYTPQHQKPALFQFTDAASLTWRTHSIRFGYESRFKKNTMLDSQRTLPSYNFDGSFSGESMADLMLGLTQAFSAYTQVEVDQRQNYYAAFVQDDWKITHRLTANLGLRYEYATPSYGNGNFRNVNFDFQTGTLVRASGSDRYLINPDRLNFAPRVGLAYQALPNRLVLSAGFGIFYSGEEIYGSETNLPLNAPGLLAINLTRPSGGATPLKLSNPVPTNLFSNADPSTLQVRARDRNYQTPRAYQFNATVQYQLPWESSFQASYVGNRGQHLYGTYQANQVRFGLDGAVAANRPYPNWGRVQSGQTAANSWYDSLQMRFEHRMNKGWYTLASYTWAKGSDEVGAWNVGNSPQYLNDWAGEKAPMDQTPRHRLSMASNVQLPFGRGQRFGGNMNRALDAVVGGWQFAGILTLQAGMPVNVTLGRTGTNPLTGSNYTFFDRNGGFLRPNCVANVNRQTGIDPRTDRLRYLNVNAFVIQPVNTPGNCPRNSTVGPRYANLDFSAKKSFSLTDKIQVGLRLEAFNVVNNVNFNRPSAAYGSATFGQISGSTDPRIIQTAIRISF